MTRYSADGSRAVDPIPLAIGDGVRLDGDAEWWTVQATSEHFAACTRPPTQSEVEEYIDEWGEEPDGPYTVLDWRNGVRGPCDLIGQGWGDGTYTTSECAAMLEAFEVTDDDIRAVLDAPRTYRTPAPLRVHVSQRNWVPLRVIEHQPGGAR